MSDVPNDIIPKNPRAQAIEKAYETDWENLAQLLAQYYWHNHWHAWSDRAKEVATRGMLTALEQAFKALPSSVVRSEEKQEPLSFGYINWRGEYAERSAIPNRIEHRESEWHGPGKHYIMVAWDVEKQAERDFLLSDMGRCSPAFGGKLVPVEPTEEMLWALFPLNPVGRTQRDLYNAMLAAAPSAPTLPIEEDAGEQKLSVEEAAQEAVRNLKSKQRLAFRKALATLPEIAPPEVASLLSSVHMQDVFWSKGKELQRIHGLNAVSPRVEQECGAGAWYFMRQGVLDALPSSAVRAEEGQEPVAREQCKSCHGTGQPGGVMGGPDRGVCGYCLGTGYKARALASPIPNITDQGHEEGLVERFEKAVRYFVGEQRYAAGAYANPFEPELDAARAALIAELTRCRALLAQKDPTNV